MRTRVWAGLVVLMGVPVLGLAGGAPIEVKTVKYKEMGDLVSKNRGKVVVVDFWGDFCIPCKKEFPHLVELNKRYAKEGLVAISVAVDPPAADLNQRLLKYLNKVQANFMNLYLDEKNEVWQKKLSIEAVPCVFVFDRQGKFYRFGGAENAPRPANYSQIEPLVVELLKQK